jgi:adenosylcobinamide-phosphate synthase
MVMTGRDAAVVVALVADRLLGEPPASWHPVAHYGRAMEALERRWYADRRGAGIAYTAAGVGAALATARGLRPRGRRSADRPAAGPRSRRGRGGAGPAWQMAWMVGFQELAAVSLATYIAVAGKALGDAAETVAAPLRIGDLVASRQLLPALVGRDPSQLDATEISRAVVESVAENTVDAVVAPVFWAAVAGAPGVLAYRAVNTLDAMVGHRSPHYARFGWASARADDLAAWLPARLTALLVAAVRPASAVQVWIAVRTQAPDHPSPNAGVAEASFAAALGLRLGGRNSYGDRSEVRPALGDGRSAEVRDIERARALSRDVTIALGLLVLAPRLLVLAPRLFVLAPRLFVLAPRLLAPAPIVARRSGAVTSRRPSRTSRRTTRRRSA